MKQPELFYFENEARRHGHCVIAGVDEAGRGPLAGPVVAAAVILPHDGSFPEGISDSKKLSATQRKKVLFEIKKNNRIRWAAGLVEAAEIDRINILQATHRAMKKAVEALGQDLDFCLVDGLPVKGLPVEHQAIVKGDSLSYSIAAASIIAKESRDAIMVEYASEFPHYGFEKHKGYGTKMHMKALAEHGPCPIHRMSFAPVKRAHAHNE